MLRFAMRSVSAAGLGVGFALMVTASCGQRFSTTSEGAGGQADADPSPGGGTDQPSGGGSGEGSGGRGLDDGGAPSTDAGGVGAKGGATASPGGAADGSGGEAGTGGGGTSGPGGVNGASGAGGRRSCPTIEVKAATFAANCAAPTDLTSYVTADCDGRTQCDFTLLPPSDPAFGCEKELSIEYDCVGPACVGGEQNVVGSSSAYIPGDVVGASTLLSCECL